jgi:abortive infection alpha-like protein
MADANRRGRPLPRPLPAVSRPGQLARMESPQAAQVVAAAGTALVGAARMGRMLTRTGWGLARRLPGGEAIQREVQRLQDAALTEVRRILDVPDQVDAPTGGLSTEEQRAVWLVNNDSGNNPLRAAMSELLERSVEPSRESSREYLFGNIVSQLVPDEARILAALSDGSTHAAGDVTARGIGRGPGRLILANVSTVGRSAGVVSPDNVPTYLTRLYRLGLVEFGPADDSLGVQYDMLGADATVRSAEETARTRRLGSARLVRKTVSLSPFGREFWVATDPNRAALPPPS